MRRELARVVHEALSIPSTGDGVNSAVHLAASKFSEQRGATILRTADLDAIADLALSGTTPVAGLDAAIERATAAKSTPGANAKGAHNSGFRSALVDLLVDRSKASADADDPARGTLRPRCLRAGGQRTNASRRVSTADSRDRPAPV